ncbi:MAG: hypothetical protein ACAI43_22240 [Phycisphaerae bacterium]
MRTLAMTIVAITLMVSLIACKDEPRPSAPVSGTTHPTALPPASPVAKPGWILGVVYGPDNKPLSKGVTVIATARSSFDWGGKTYELKPDAAGQYAVQAKEGNYKLWATIDVDYNGRHFKLPLAPVDGKGEHDVQRVAERLQLGIVKGFQWRLTGLQPGGTEKDGPYFGVGVNVSDAAPRFEPDTHLSKKYPGSSVVVRLEPTGPLVDGSAGKPLDLESPTDSLYDDRNPKRKFPDLPLGDYKATARLKLKDGTERPLNVAALPRPLARKPAIPAARQITLEFAQPAEGGWIPAFELAVSE